jgi:predicted 3-demethylubiquinone-9 3-methyltransferase (glyoxalase superfamily)
MQKITPHLWFDKEAREAGAFYTSLFPNSRVKSTVTIHDTPGGDADVVTIELAGHEFQLLSAGPLFKFNPSISFMVSCDSKNEVDELWRRLSERGSVLMELGEYPFSERYGWLADRYGVSWQLFYTGGQPVKQKITTALMFTGDKAGKAEEAMKFYTSLFPNASIDEVHRYPAGAAPDREGTVMYGGFRLSGEHFAAMDSAHEHGFQFNEAISLIVNCETQKEIDQYWSSLSADPSAEQCGWLKDRFGVSWQIVPTAMDRMFQSGDDAAIARVTQAFLQMKKFDIAKLEDAFRGTATAK